MIGYLARFQNTFETFVKPYKSLTNVVRDKTILDFQYNNDRIHDIKWEVVDRTLVIHFFICL